jgi:hypothetical protein
VRSGGPPQCRWARPQRREEGGDVVFVEIAAGPARALEQASASAAERRQLRADGAAFGW